MAKQARVRPSWKKRQKRDRIKALKRALNTYEKAILFLEKNGKQLTADQIGDLKSAAQVHLWSSTGICCDFERKE
jgi:hypothetical protein